MGCECFERIIDKGFVFGVFLVLFGRGIWFMVNLVVVIGFWFDNFFVGWVWRFGIMIIRMGGI